MRSDYDNSNRLTSIAKKVSDTDIDGIFEATDRAATTSQALNIDQGSNKLLGFNQSVLTQATVANGTRRTVSNVISAVNYQLDAYGNLVSDGLRAFDYNAENRLGQVNITKDGEAAKITYLHNAAGQRIFKSEPQTAQALPNETVLGTTFTDWLKKNFQWLYATAQTNATLGTSYSYGDGQLPSWAMTGEYGNGGATSAGRTEYIWLPTDDGSAIPIGMFRSNRFYAIHSDHLGTPRLMTDDTAKPVWQWAYSAFGDNKPTGVLKVTTNPNSAITNQPVLLQATGVGTTLNLRFPGQYADSETGLFYNYFRTYQPNQGRYTQNDPIGLDGGLNRSIYVDANPMSFTDPDGLKGRPSRGRSTASDAAGYHDPRGNLVCEQWTCPSSSSMCMQGDQKRPTDFLPVATTEAPRGCSCTRYAYRPDWRPPNQDISDDWNRTRDLLGDAYNTHRDAKDQAPRFNNGLGRLPHWHRLGGYGK